MNVLHSTGPVRARAGFHADGTHALLRRESTSRLAAGLAALSSAASSDVTVVIGDYCSGKTTLGRLLRSEADQQGVPFYVPPVSRGWGTADALLDDLGPLRSLASASELPPTSAARLLCFIDDIDHLHEADIRQLLALVRMARDAGSSLSLVGTARSVPTVLLTADDTRIVSHPQTNPADADEALNIRVVELEPLTSDETRELAHLRAASWLSEEGVTRVQAATRGNPLLVAEATYDSGFAELVEAAACLDTATIGARLLEESAARRARSISPREELALRLISLGPGIDQRVLTGIVGAGEPDLPSVLRLLEESRLIRLDPGSDTYTLHDSAIALYVEGCFPAAERAECHGRVANAYLRRGSAGTSNEFALAAWHLGAAGELDIASRYACGSLSAVVEQKQCVVAEALLDIIERASLDVGLERPALATTLAEAANAAWTIGNAPIALRMSGMGLRIPRTGTPTCDETELKLLWNRGRAQALSGSVDGAVKTLRVAQNTPLAERSEEWQARLLLVWCIVYQMRGEFGSIRVAGSRALALAESVGAEDLLGSSCNAIGNALQALCLWTEAREWHKKAVCVGEDIGDRRGVLVNRFDIALADFSLGLWDQAESELAEVISEASRFGHAYVLELAQNVMGLLLLGRGDLAAARDSFHAALAASRECGDEWGLALSYSNRGALEREFGRPHAALRLFERAQHLMDRVGSRDDLPELFRRRAEAHLDLGDADEAADLASQALELAKEFSNPLEEWNCTRALSQVAVSRGDPEEAAELAMRAAEGLASIEARFEEALALRLLGEVERALGRYDDSAGNARKALETFSALSARREARRTRELLSSLDDPTVVTQSTQTLEPRRLASLCRSSTMLAGARSAMAVARETADIAASEIPVDVAAVCLAVGSTECVVSELCSAKDVEAARASALQVCGALEPEQDGIAVVDPSRDDSNAAATAGSLGVNRAIVAPLRARESSFGHIYLDYRTRDADFTDDDIRFIEALAAQAATALENIYSFSNIIGRSVEMQKVFSLLERVSSSSATVLVEGESGTGKELVARAIHHNSPRRNERFVPQNCAALPEQLLESELFGHVRGAFTGALKEKRGLFEAADGGTFFLDEIADMPPSLQVKRRVGATDSISVDVRIIAATNKSLEGEVRAGRFRQDLFYRLNVVRVEMPPLRVRRDDIPLLAQHFLDNCAAESGRDIQGFTDGAMNRLVNYDWPGNVRELENEMQRAVALAREDAPISEKDLSERIRTCEVTEDAPKHGASLDLKDMVEDIERRVILQMLEEYHWNKSKTAEALGLSRQGLLKKIARLKLQRREE